MESNHHLTFLLPVWTPVNLCHSWIKVQSGSRTHIPDISGHFTLKLSELCDHKRRCVMKHKSMNKEKQKRFWAPIGLNYVYWFIRPALKNRRGQDPNKVAFPYSFQLGLSIRRNHLTSMEVMLFLGFMKYTLSSKSHIHEV